MANLPYGVAATVVLKSIEELPDARLWSRWCSSRSARRLAAAPGSKEYGGHRACSPSSRARSRCCGGSRRTSSTRCRTSSRRSCASRAWPRRPRRTSSSWCTPRSRTGARRCRLARARGRRPRAGAGGARRARPSGRRARGAALAGRLPPPRGDTARRDPRAGAREGQPAAARGQRRADGLHELCSLFASIDLADEVTVEPADADEVRLPRGRGAEPGARRRSSASAPRRRRSCRRCG